MVDREHEVCRRLCGFLGSLNDTRVLLWFCFSCWVMRGLWRRFRGKAVLKEAWYWVRGQFCHDRPDVEREKRVVWMEVMRTMMWCSWWYSSYDRLMFVNMSSGGYRGVKLSLYPQHTGLAHRSFTARKGTWVSRVKFWIQEGDMLEALLSFGAKELRLGRPSNAKLRMWLRATLFWFHRERRDTRVEQIKSWLKERGTMFGLSEVLFASCFRQKGTHVTTSNTFASS